MPPRNPQRAGGRGGYTVRREAHIGTLLTSSQRDELVVLVANITDAMLQQISQVFDQRPTTTITRMPLNVAGNQSNIKPGGSISNGSLSPSKQHYLQRNQGRGQGQGQLATIDYATIPPENGRANPDEGTQSDLKKEALASFKRWQSSVVKRLSELVVADDPPQYLANASTRPNGRPSGRGAPGRGSLSRFNGPGRGGHSGITQVFAQRHAADTQGKTLPQLPQIPFMQRLLLAHTMLLLLLSLESYPSYSRVLMVRLAAHIHVPLEAIANDEARVAISLASAAESALTEDGLLKKPEDVKKERRGRYGAGPGGSTALAPFLNDAKIGSVVGMPGLGSAAAASVLGNLGTLADGGLAACVFFGLCGMRGSPAKSLDTFSREIQDISLVPLHGAKKMTGMEDKRALCPKVRGLRLTIGISGWLRKPNDDCQPWRVLGPTSEAYALRWERDAIAKVGISLDTVARSLAWQTAKQQFVNRNVFESLKSFQWPADMLKLSKIVDNPWSVGMVRADKVGIALADSIAHKVPGERGVSLLGYGLGARVIYTCLMSLSERRIFGLVENVMMMGAPAPSSHSVWTAIRSVVAGRVINVFSENDCMLGFLHRTSCVQYGVAGLQRVNDVLGIENVDATKPVTSHARYAQLVGRILKDVGWEDLDLDEVRKSEEASAMADAEAEKKQEQKLYKPVEPNPVEHAQIPVKRRKRPGRKNLVTQFQGLSIAN